MPVSDEWADILKDFLVESSEILESLSLDILALENNPKDLDLLNKLFRGVHTIKGSAGFLGLVNLAKFAHKFEDLLNKLRKFELEVDSSVIDVLLISSDLLKEIIALIKEKNDDNLDTAPCLAKIEALLSKTPSPPVAAAVPPPVPIPKEEPKAVQEELAKEFKEAESQAKPESIPPPPSAPAPLPEKKEEPPKKLGEILVEEKIIRPEDLEEALKAQEQTPKLGEVLVDKALATQEQVEEALKKQKKKEPLAEQTIRVDVMRLDNLMNLVGELVLCRNRFYELYKSIQEYDLPDALNSSIGETINQIAFNTSELQTSVMKTRMLPISRVFSKFQRLIRELEKQTGKEVELEIKGEETELDKTIIEEIGDPLIHLIRNGLDHGIEFPEERIAKGKPAKGHLLLSASHQGSQIVIEIQDDGRGMNVERILEKGIKNGLLDAEKAKKMSKREILDLIFLPGFSTAEKITDVSGRGVGMDVVKNKVTQLKGMIEIDTEKDKGSNIKLKLPLTLAIIQVLIISAGKHLFAIPLTNVVENLRIRKEEIYLVDGREVIEFRGRIIPLVYLKKAYHLEKEGEALPPKEEEGADESRWSYIVIVGLGEKQKGIVVDSFVEQEEIVIKSLTKFLSDVKGFAGCTIRGDGRVSLIVDIEHLINE